jgi:hypothetical protein
MNDKFLTWNLKPFSVTFQTVCEVYALELRRVTPLGMTSQQNEYNTTNAIVTGIGEAAIVSAAA